MAKRREKKRQFSEFEQGDWGRKLAELEKAVSDSKVSVVQLAEAHYGRLEEPNPDASSRKKFEELYPQALRSYEAAKGPVLRSFYSSVVWAWVLVSKKEGLKIGCRPKAQDIIEFTNRSLEMAARASDYLLSSSRGVQNILYAAVNQAIGNLEERHARGSLGPSSSDAQFMSSLDKQIVRAESLVRRGAKLIYLGGVLAGLLLSFLLALAVVFSAGLTQFHAFTQPLAFTAILFGALGGSMSVLQRFRAASLEVDIASGRWLIILSGLFRPPVGGLAGLIAYMAHSSGLLLSSLSLRNPNEATLFYGVVAFFSGFTERVFQAQLGVTES